MASILCGTQACIWTGNREISWRHCRKTQAGFGMAFFFILAMGQAGVPLPKPKDREELCFSPDFYSSRNKNSPKTAS
ncbi:MAG: hypothetical protein BAA00_10685 [Parageobacillus thermoglucosidasius]|nr:MAG: hypothetical protein BAA00_10685 [Parageobacillus thermoglucosidasius]